MDCYISDIDQKFGNNQLGNFLCVSCKSCGAMGPSLDNTPRSLEEAALVWNNRYEDGEGRADERRKRLVVVAGAAAAATLAV